jgi:hypothetical protein
MFCYRGIRRHARYRRGEAIAAAANGLNAAASGLPCVENSAKGGDLHVEIAVFDRRSWPDCGNDLGPRHEFAWPLDQHREDP